MLKNDFFSITGQEIADHAADFVVRFHEQHGIFQAHFPNNPIVPGVCIIQVGKELFSFLKQTCFTIKKIKSVKFTHPIIPALHPEVTYALTWEDAGETGLFYVKLTINAGEVVFSKINMQLKEGRL